MFLAMSSAAGASGNKNSTPSARAVADIPPELLPIYQKAAKDTCDMPWGVLAAIGKVETDHGRSQLPGVSSGENSSGAGGPMKFLQPRWDAYGVDGDGDKDRYDPVDAIWGAANYLCAGGAADPARLRDAIWAYIHFGGKSGVVKAIYQRALLGTGRDPAYERSDAMRELETDPRAIMRQWGLLTAEVASVVSPIRLLMRAAALADPEMGELLRETDEDRLARMHHHARFLMEHGYLRGGVSVREATDVLWVCSSVEIYDLLVVQRGWSLQRFAAFVSDS
jgi:hypothetical protein